MDKQEYLNLISENTTQDVLYSVFEGVQQSDQSIYNAFRQFFEDGIRSKIFEGYKLVLAKYEETKPTRSKMLDAAIVGEEKIYLDENLINNLRGDLKYAENISTMFDVMIDRGVDITPHQQKVKEDIIQEANTLYLKLNLFFRRVLTQRYIKKLGRVPIEVSAKNIVKLKIKPEEIEKINEQIRIQVTVLKELPEGKAILEFSQNKNKLVNWSKYPSMEAFGAVEAFMNKIFIELDNLISENLSFRPFQSRVEELDGVVILFRNFTAEIAGAELPNFIRIYKQVYSKLVKKKLQKAVSGMTMYYDFISPSPLLYDRVAGLYFIGGSERLKNFKLRGEEFKANSVLISGLGLDAETMAHEIGHRYWYLEMTQDQRDVFDRLTKYFTIRKRSLYNPEGKKNKGIIPELLKSLRGFKKYVLEQEQTLEKDLKGTAYEILQVSKDSTQKELKKAYRKRARELHPDRPTGDTEKFKLLNSVYAMLSDPSKRERYDRQGAKGVFGTKATEKDLTFDSFDIFINTLREYLIGYEQTGGIRSLGGPAPKSTRFSKDKIRKIISFIYYIVDRESAIEADSFINYQREYSGGQYSLRTLISSINKFKDSIQYRPESFYIILPRFYISWYASANLAAMAGSDILGGMGGAFNNKKSDETVTSENFAEVFAFYVLDKLHTRDPDLKKAFEAAVFKRKDLEEEIAAEYERIDDILKDFAKQFLDPFGMEGDFLD
jgi:curved DNA-binding protein CbpA